MLYKRKGYIMDYQNIIYSFNDGVATITLNRPKAWNALCAELNDEMIDILNKIKYKKILFFSFFLTMPFL